MVGAVGPRPGRPSTSVSATVNGPSAEVVIDVALVRALVDEQHPDLADQRIEPFAHGWDNELFTLGDDLLVRLPRRDLAAALVENELQWLSTVAVDLTLATPIPIHAGRPGSGYPWAWTITPRFAGRTALVAPFVDPAQAAHDLGVFVAAVRRLAPDDAPRNPYRGVPLRDRDELVADALGRLRNQIPADAVTVVWHDVREVPPWNGEPMWLHGDLHPGNLVVDEGQLRAVIDFGDVCAGDPATDLGVAWMLFGREDRHAFRVAAAVGADAVGEAMWQRGRGWALAIALAVAAGSDDFPAMQLMGLRTVARVLGD